MEMEIPLTPRQTPGASVVRSAAGWRLDLPAGPSRTYRLAQLDDYANTPRSHLQHTPPWTFRLRARLSGNNLPGTWGFGLWNDPFGLSLGFGGKPGRLPALPHTAWFMHASPPNWLSLQKSPGTVPAHGFFAGTFRSPRIPSLLFLPGLLALPVLVIKPFSRLLRRLAGRVIHQDGARINVDVTQWHDYSMVWSNECCVFSVDGSEVLRTESSPRPPLGLVIWIDNQYAAWTPEGRLKYGTLENPIAWLEIENLNIENECQVPS
jgi:hypothetical protein